MISTPYPRLNCSKTLPFTAAHTYTPYIWEYPPPLPRGDAYLQDLWFVGMHSGFHSPKCETLS